MDTTGQGLQSIHQQSLARFADDELAATEDARDPGSWPSQQQVRDKILLPARGRQGDAARNHWPSDRSKPSRQARPCTEKESHVVVAGGVGRHRRIIIGTIDHREQAQGMFFPRPFSSAEGLGRRAAKGGFGWTPRLTRLQVESIDHAVLGFEGHLPIP